MVRTLLASEKSIRPRDSGNNIKTKLAAYEEILGPEVAEGSGGPNQPDPETSARPACAPYLLVHAAQEIGCVSHPRYFSSKPNKVLGWNIKLFLT